MSIADLEALNLAYVTAIDAEEWHDALKVLTKIAARLATTPNLSRSLGGGGNQSITWTAQAIADQQAFCTKQLAASRIARRGPITSTPIRYVRPGASDTY